jgi:hypothetical protein
VVTDAGAVESLEGLEEAVDLLRGVARRPPPTIAAVKQGRSIARAAVLAPPARPDEFLTLRRSNHEEVTTKEDR